MSVKRLTVTMTSAKGQRSSCTYEAPPGDKIDGVTFPFSVGFMGGKFEMEISLEEYEEPEIPPGPEHTVERF